MEFVLQYSDMTLHLPFNHIKEKNLVSKAL